MVRWGTLPSADLSLYPHTVEGAWDLSGDSFVRAPMPFMRTPPTWPNHPPKGSHLLIRSSLGVRISTFEFRGDTNIQTIAVTLLPLADSFFFSSDSVYWSLYTRFFLKCTCLGCSSRNSNSLVLGRGSSTTSLKCLMVPIWQLCRWAPGAFLLRGQVFQAAFLEGWERVEHLRAPCLHAVRDGHRSVLQRPVWVLLPLGLSGPQRVAVGRWSFWDLQLSAQGLAENWSPKLSHWPARLQVIFHLMIPCWSRLL